MAISIGDSRIEVYTPHGARACVDSSGSDVLFSSTPILIHGAVDLRGAPSRSCENWVVGFTQLQFIEVNQRRYRGAAQNDGSMWIDRAAHRSQLCRDTMKLPRSPSAFASPPPTPWNPFWYAHTEAHGLDPHGDPIMGTRVLTTADHIAANGILMVRTDMVDYPGEWAEFELPNTEPPGPPRPNYLHSVDIEQHFCTMLTVINPRGEKHFLRHVYWNVHWSGLFSGRTFIPRADHGFHIQNRYGRAGVPRDPRFAGAAGRVGLINCSVAAFHGTSSPATYQRRDWSLS